MIADGAILVRNGVIEACGSTRQIQSLSAARGCEEIDATGKVVMPAFIDLDTCLVHAHPAPRTFDRLSRNYDHPDPEVFRDILYDGARALAGLSSHSLRRRVGVVADGMLRHGTGTVEARAGYQLNESGAMKVLRVQSESGTPLHIISTLLLQLPPGQDPALWAKWVCHEFLPLVRRRRLASFVDLEYDRNSLPAPIASRILTAASQLGLGIKVSGDFFALLSAVPLAVREQAISVSNLRRITPDEIELLGASSTIGILKPGQALQTGMSYAAPGRELIDLGVIPALASGYHAEMSPGYSMQLIVLLACRLYRFRPEEAITAATINNACAIKAEASVGSIQSGKLADIVILNASDYREVGYYAGVNMVDKMIKAGKVVYDAAAPTLRAA